MSDLIIRVSIQILLKLWTAREPQLVVIGRCEKR